MENKLNFGASVLQLRSKVTAVVAATMLAAGSVVPAWATIDNTVTVTGSSPSGTNDVTDTATENVDVQDAAPVLTVTKTADATSLLGEVAAGSVITYTYTVQNDGNVGVTDVSLSDDHNVDADGALGTITLGALTDNGTLGDSTDDAADNDYDYLAPGDLVTWTATYTVTAQDIADQSADGDGNLDNEVTASAGFEDSTGSPDTTTGTATEEVDLEDRNASLTVAKVGTYGAGPTTVNGTTDNLPVGEVITYTYTITNDGNVPVTQISLGDVHNGSGTSPAPDADSAALTDNVPAGDSTNPTTGDNEWDTLAPGDVLVVTATYTVTQSDVDNLQ